MVFDFESLSTGDTLATLTDPITLFEALPDKKAGYGYLRAVQQAVLEQWSKRRDQRDVVVKTNTGGGKTVVGLLILQCCLNEGNGPALYLAPTSDLARRVQEEAINLGLTTVDDPQQPKFLRGEAICVTTMNVLVNGKTRFGLTVPESRHLPVPVGSVIIDDAHAALSLVARRLEEIDRATESLPTVKRKLVAYLDLANRRETAPDSSVLPRVLVTVPHDRRLQAVKGVVRQLPEPAEQLLSVTLQDRAAAYLTDALRE